jgi:hypothetical protein
METENLDTMPKPWNRLQNNFKISEEKSVIIAWILIIISEVSQVYVLIHMLRFQIVIVC